jgi:hypothetical protein
MRKPAVSRTTFGCILDALKAKNLVHVKNRAFLANRVAKISSGRSRGLAYAVKNRAIDQLVRNGSVRVNSVRKEPSLLVGLSFSSGGRLHAKPQWLSSECRLAVERQAASLFSPAMRSVNGAEFRGAWS